MADDRTNHLTPPPQKRIKSVDLYRAQHGLSPSENDSNNKDHDIQPIPPHHHQRSRNSDRSRDNSLDMSHDRDRSRDSNRDHDRDRSLELRESLLGQALEATGSTAIPPVLIIKYIFRIPKNFNYPIPFSLETSPANPSRPSSSSSTKYR